MSIAYAQMNKNAVQTKRESSVSIIDSSSQSESLQRKANMANNAAQRAEAPRPNNTGMPDNLKSGIESLSGFSMDDVRVHYNSSKPATVQALAYTQGTDIHVAPGQEKHLPHEAWHVAQQMAGRVSPTTNINGMPVNDNAALEHEADVMGEKAVGQRKENVEIKSKNAPREALQLKPGGNIDLVCAADVLYRLNGDIEPKRVKGVGFNNFDDKDSVLGTFERFGLVKLGKGEYQGIYQTTLTDAALPGVCAEPHAVSNALENLEKNENLTKETGKKIEIKDIYVGDAVVRKYKDESHDEVVYGTRGKKTAKDSSGVNTCKRCPTCQNWINADGHVKKEFLPNSTLEDCGSTETGMKFDKKMVAKTKIAESKETISIDSSKSFHDIDLLGGLRLSEKVTYQDWKKLNNDDELREINQKKGLRTIIKKQMLKNRIFEMDFSDEKRDAICKEIDDTAQRKKNLRKPGANRKQEDVQDGYECGYLRQIELSGGESPEYIEGFSNGRQKIIEIGRTDGFLAGVNGYARNADEKRGPFYCKGYYAGFDDGCKKAVENQRKEEAPGREQCTKILENIEKCCYQGMNVFVENISQILGVCSQSEKKKKQPKKKSHPKTKSRRGRDEAEEKGADNFDIESLQRINDGEENLFYEVFLEQIQKLKQHDLACPEELIEEIWNILKSECISCYFSKDDE